MIKLIDLRHGNYFQIEDIGPLPLVDFSCDFTGALHHMQFLAELSFHRGRVPDRSIKTVIPALWDVQPISLSPEILEKCGFEMVEEEYEPSVGDAIGRLFYNNMSIIQQKDSGKFHLLLDGGPDSHEYGFTGIEVRSIHQLQNLYFSLTGEELTVKLYP
jgi:hypothetical protein